MRIVEDEPITAERILELAPASRERTLYLSGAEPMVESVGAALVARGVGVKQDWFPGYDEKTYCSAWFVRDDGIVVVPSGENGMTIATDTARHDRLHAPEARARSSRWSSGC